MTQGYRVKCVGLRKMLPNEWWGSCRVVTEGAVKRSFAVTEGVLNSSLLTPNFSLLFNAGGIK